MKYTVCYFSGADEEYQDGIWEIKKMPKTTTAEKIGEKGIYGMHNVGEKIRIGKGTGSPIRYEREDGGFTVYFKQAGTPYIFTPLKSQ
jgi:hypothetical protein